MKVEIKDITEDKPEVYLELIDFKNIYRKFHTNKIEHHNNPYHLLLCAKSCFVERDYELCLEALSKV